ncbi:glycine cleavage system aminomethyltransferase GcvT [Roseospira marina]|uniref:aminomethyltransferase n=1 Tax=Roseospira marina TaxID=140057 RepID=A0A5M6I8T3_9PROT|nr:glycine cleavage system aminomethyltransferase GcvT [Roseospira marina]KAA5604552.1 glycine cleavage system aminomethyltransferase GcvT [Roseospira marina]MBB4315299.1 aminomethyltransferase [Roseospira marina]MBB5088298.1 aminomethyltransferase [Roseospira marina]
MSESAASPSEPPLRTTPLDALHRELGGKMVPFAGYAMPVQYPAGVLKEHLHTRAKAGLFDVSHMGQVRLTGDDPAGALERIVPGAIRAVKPGRQRYTLLLNETGGILDDLMVANAGDHLFAVLNAACKAEDIAHLRAHLTDVDLVELTEHALLALQGPAAAAVLETLAPEVATMRFMDACALEIRGVPCFVTRSGYTGEDGFEISVPADAAEDLARTLLAHEDVAPIGLGARDSLRLEAGLCLYGSDIDTTTTPIEADLAWTLGKARREAGDFPGAEIILEQLRDGPGRKRVGIRPEGRAPARAGTPIHAPGGEAIGVVTSGGFGPTVEGPVAMGYVPAPLAAPGTELDLMVRGRALPARVVSLPFTPPRQHRG